MRDLHKVYLKDGQVWLDEIPLKGVRHVDTGWSYESHATVRIELIIDPGEPDMDDFHYWSKERMLTEEKWKKMMSKKAQELLDGLS